MQWLWLEDQEGTVTGLRTEVEKAVDVKFFGKIADLTRYLLAVSEDIIGGRLRLGFILDVMITNAYKIVRPAGWYGCEAESFFDTDNGFWAGLVYYKDLVLGPTDNRRALIHPPPPVIFLTVMHEDAAEVPRRLKDLKAAWKKASGGSETPKVKWARKSDTSAADLVALLRELEV